MDYIQYKGVFLIPRENWLQKLRIYQEYFLKDQEKSHRNFENIKINFENDVIFVCFEHESLLK